MAKRTVNNEEVLDSVIENCNKWAKIFEESKTTSFAKAAENNGVSLISVYHHLEKFSNTKFACLNTLSIAKISDLLRAQESSAVKLLRDILGDDSNKVYYLDPDSEDALVNRVKEALKDREFQIIAKRYSLLADGENSKPMTYEEIGQEFGVTKERIRQIHAKALRKLRNPKVIKDLFSSDEDLLEYENLKEEHEEICRILHSKMQNFSDLREKFARSEKATQICKNAIAELENLDVVVIPRTKTIDECGFSPRTRNALARRFGSDYSVIDLVNLSLCELQSVRNLGKRSVDEINDFCKQEYGAYWY